MRATSAKRFLKSRPIGSVGVILIVWFEGHPLKFICSLPDMNKSGGGLLNILIIPKVGVGARGVYFAKKIQYFEIIIVDKVMI